MRRARRAAEAVNADRGNDSHRDGAGANKDEWPSFWAFKRFKLLTAVPANVRFAPDPLGALWAASPRHDQFAVAAEQATFSAASAIVSGTTGS